MTLKIATSFHRLNKHYEYLHFSPDITNGREFHEIYPILPRINITDITNKLKILWNMCAISQHIKNGSKSVQNYIFLSNICTK